MKLGGCGPNGKVDPVVDAILDGWDWVLFSYVVVEVGSGRSSIHNDDLPR